MIHLYISQFYWRIIILQDLEKGLWGGASNVSTCTIDLWPGDLCSLCYCHLIHSGRLKMQSLTIRNHSLSQQHHFPPFPVYVLNSKAFAGTGLCCSVGSSYSHGLGELILTVEIAQLSDLMCHFNLIKNTLPIRCKYGSDDLLNGNKNSSYHYAVPSSDSLTGDSKGPFVSLCWLA